MILRGMRRYIRVLVVLGGLLVACVGLGGVHSGCAYANWCTDRFYALKGDAYMHYRQHPCEIAVNEICTIWKAEGAALLKNVHTYNARCAGTPERLIDNPNDQGGRYRQQPLQQHHAQAHPPKEAGAGAGRIQSYQDAVNIVRSRLSNIVGTSRGKKVGTVKNMQELKELENSLIFGLKPYKIINESQGLTKMYRLPDQTVITLRDSSKSGGAAIDINPPKGSPKGSRLYKVHIEQ